VLKITINFNDDIQLLYTFHLQITINTIIIYILVETKFSMSDMCHNHHGQNF